MDRNTTQQTQPCRYRDLGHLAQGKNSISAASRPAPAGAALTSAHVSEKTSVISAANLHKKRKRTFGSCHSKLWDHLLQSAAALKVHRMYPQSHSASSEVLADPPGSQTVSYTHLRAHETPEQLVCRLLLAN